MLVSLKVHVEYSLASNYLSKIFVWPWCVQPSLPTSCPIEIRMKLTRSEDSWVISYATLLSSESVRVGERVLKRWIGA